MEDNLNTICNKCNRHFIDGLCFMHYDDEHEYTEIKNSDNIMNDDKTCDYFQKITIFMKISNYFSQKLYGIKMKYYEIRSFFKNNLYGRIKYGFNIEDTWNLDTNIAKYMYPRVEYLSNHVNGYPGWLTDGKFLETNNLDKYYNDDKSIMWENILKGISYGFKKYLENDNEYSDNKEVYESLRLMTLFYENLWD